VCGRTCQRDVSTFEVLSLLLRGQFCQHLGRPDRPNLLHGTLETQHPLLNTVCIRLVIIRKTAALEHLSTRQLLGSTNQSRWDLSQRY
jgi:hypothetical protein